MKLFLVGDFPKDDKIYGGVQGVLINLLNELIIRDELEIVIIALSTECDLKRFEGKCKTHKLQFRSAFVKSKKRFDKLVLHEKPDIIHLQNVIPGVLLYKKDYNKKFIVTQHAILNEEIHWQVSFRRKLLFRAKALIEKYYLRKIENIIFISEYNQKVYFERAPAERILKFQLIPNPVNDIFIESHNSFIPQNKNELFFVGEIKKRKGIHILIQALHELNQQGCKCKLHVIGGFKESNYEKEIVHLVESLNLTENILFSGWKNQIDMMKYTKNIPVFVLPSFQETLPLSVAEAMCQGKIVVATNICGIPEMIDDGVSGYLFTPGDFTELAGILKKIFTSMAHQKNVSDKARLAREKYNAKHIVDKTLDFYKTLLTDHLK